MSEDRTEKATPKRREEARNRGQVARSQEINTGFSLLGLFVLLSAFGASTYEALAALMVESFTKAGPETTINANTAWALMMDLMFTGLRILAPYLLGAMVIGVVASVVQVRPRLLASGLKPNFQALSPKSGIKRIFSLRSLVNLVKDLVKIAIVGTVTWIVLRGQAESLAMLMGADPRTTLGVVGGLILKLGYFGAAAYLVMAAADFGYQRWQHEKDMRMTKEEVKREMKEQDVSPEVKGQMKRRQREMATRRMMDAVPGADVVITNPTHYAVALKYARDLPAPQVVAKGADNVALRIRGIATENGVSIVEDPPLARSLFAAAEVGQYIPAEAFAAVAEILAAVYRAGNRTPAVAA